MYVDAEVRVGRDTAPLPGVHLHGATTIGAECVIGPNCEIEDAAVDDGARVINAVVRESHIGPNASVGPFAYVRPETHLSAQAKIGTFVETKNAVIGPRAKVPHLSNIGDAEIGEDINIGAGNITANYDGFRNLRTTVGARVKTGSDCALVAPVTIGDDAMDGGGFDHHRRGSRGRPRNRASPPAGDRRLYEAGCREGARGTRERRRASGMTRTSIDRDDSKRMMVFTGRRTPSSLTDRRRPRHRARKRQAESSPTARSTCATWRASAAPTSSSIQSDVPPVNAALMELLIMVDAASRHPPAASPRSSPTTATRVRTRSRPRASRSPRSSSPTCSPRPASTGSSRWTCTRARCRAFSGSRSTT